MFPQLHSAFTSIFSRSPSRGETLRSLKRLIAVDDDQDRDWKDGSSASNRSGMMRAGKSLEDKRFVLCRVRGQP